MRSIGFVVVFACGAVACGGGGSGHPSAAVNLSKPAASGDAQTGEVGHTLPLQLKVLVHLDSVADSGQAVTWSASGGGSVNPTTSHADASGIATTTWTLGAAAGAESATAAVGGAEGSPVSYSATALAPVVARAASSGNGQTDTVHAALATPLAVVVTLGGVPLSGRTVIWSTSNAGGTVTAVDTTAADGSAGAHWRLGTSAGAQTASATTAGAAAVATFSATARPGVAQSIARQSGDGQSADTGLAFGAPLVVKAADQFGNGRSGVTVAWLVTSGSAHVTPVTDSTLASGTASATLTAGDTLGAIVVTAAASGLIGSPVTFGGTVARTPVIIQVGDDFFAPDSIVIHAGDQVQWRWGNTVIHNVTTTGAPSFTSSANQGANTSYGPVAFGAAGIYHYYCTIHGTPTTGMRGVIVVQ